MSANFEGFQTLQQKSSSSDILDTDTGTFSGGRKSDLTEFPPTLPQNPLNLVECRNANNCNIANIENINSFAPHLQSLEDA